LSPGAHATLTLTLVSASGTLRPSFLAAGHSKGQAGALNLTILFLADTDGDQMPDTWEELFGLGPNDPADAAGDWDGDGLTNLGEFLSGTDPNDAASVLRLEMIRVEDHGFKLRFYTRHGLRYRVEQAASLSPDAAWVPRGGDLGGGDIEVEFTPTLAVGTQAFFRLRVWPEWRAP
jgi:hypothetical protein